MSNLVRVSSSQLCYDCINRLDQQILRIKVTSKVMGSFKSCAKARITLCVNLSIVEISKQHSYEWYDDDLLWFGFNLNNRKCCIHRQILHQIQRFWVGSSLASQTNFPYTAFHLVYLYGERNGENVAYASFWELLKWSSDILYKRISFRNLRMHHIYKDGLPNLPKETESKLVYFMFQISLDYFICLAGLFSYSCSMSMTNRSTTDEVKILSKSSRFRKKICWKDITGKS
jgi:hypothetical protein